MVHQEKLLAERTRPFSIILPLALPIEPTKIIDTTENQPFSFPLVLIQLPKHLTKKILEGKCSDPPDQQRSLLKLPLPSQQ